MIGPETQDIENRKWNKRTTKIKKHEEGRGGGGLGFIFNYGLLNGNQP